MLETEADIGINIEPQQPPIEGEPSIQLTWGERALNQLRAILEDVRDHDLDAITSTRRKRLVFDQIQQALSPNVLEGNKELTDEQLRLQLEAQATYSFLYDRPKDPKTGKDLPNRVEILMAEFPPKPTLNRPRR